MLFDGFKTKLVDDKLAIDDEEANLELLFTNVLAGIRESVKILKS